MISSKSQPLTVSIPNSVPRIGVEAFLGGTRWPRTYFQGHAPRREWGLFEGSDHATVFYLPSTTGGRSTFAGRTTALWNNPFLSARSIRAGGDGFAFTISRAPNSTFVLEACPHLVSRAWAPIHTNTPTCGTWEFTDPDSKAHPNRYYRVR